jgi:hypothetical protein
MMMAEDDRGDLDDGRSTRNQTKEASPRVRGEDWQHQDDLPPLRNREIDLLLWRDRYRELGEAGLARRKCDFHNHPKKTPDEVIEKILYLRRTYHMGPIRIVWYLQRYHDIQTSDATVYRICKRHGLNRLPNRVGRRAVHTHRYQKQVRGHHVQVDVKFLTLERKRSAPVRRYQYTAIDDATRVRALKIYKRHTQANAIDSINYAVKKFPFRIRTIWTDRGHEFQALFHWHVADLGMEHVYIKPRTPQLNWKVERGRSRGHIAPTRMSSTSCSPIAMTSIQEKAGGLGAVLPLRPTARSTYGQDAL